MSKKKSLILGIIFISLLIFNYFIFINKNDNLKTAFYSLDSEEVYYDYYYVTFNNLTTKNFNNILNNFDNKDYIIMKLYTTPNVKYNNNLIDKLKEYSFDNINNFVEFYIKKLDEYKYDEDINNINVYGIKIDKVLIYTSEENLKSFSNKIDGISYKKKEG